MPLLRFSTPRYAFAMRVCAALCRCLAVPRYAVPLHCLALHLDAVAVRFKAKPLPSSGMLCRCCAIPSPRDAAVRFAVAICLMSSVLCVAMQRFAVAVHIDALPSLCGAVQCSSLPSLFCASQRSAVALLVLALICHTFALLRYAAAMPCCAVPLPCEALLR